MTGLDVLFVHNNFPAQFKNLAARFAQNAGVRVRAIGAQGAPGLSGIETLRYGFSSHEVAATHAFARRFEIESRRAEQVIYAANSLKVKGFSPKLVYVHPGWGEALPLRVLFPDAGICSYSEFYYAPRGTDVGFDPEFPGYGIDGETRVVLRNAATLLALTDANVSIAPTHWQRSVFPPEFHSKIRVIHDGLDTKRLKPANRAAEVTAGGRNFGSGDEIVTFVSRNLEPYRGFHVFMRALPRILRTRPKARICIMGGDAVSYGAASEGHENWRLAMLDELRGKLDLERVHFLGKVPHATYLNLLSLSRAHVYLTYPFVLSWSMLEAMAMECLVIGSDTPPVTEVLSDRDNGIVVPFFDEDALAEAVIEAIGNARKLRPLRHAARQTIVERYDFDRVCWPKQLGLIEELLPSQTIFEPLMEASSS